MLKLITFFELKKQYLYLQDASCDEDYIKFRLRLKDYAEKHLPLAPFCEQNNHVIKWVTEQFNVISVIVNFTNAYKLNQSHRDDFFKIFPEHPPKTIVPTVLHVEMDGSRMRKINNVLQNENTSVNFEMLAYSNIKTGSYLGSYHFKNKIDALLFKLTWV